MQQISTHNFLVRVRTVEEVPAIHAARLVFLFLCSCFLNYGCIAAVLLAVYAVRFILTPHRQRIQLVELLAADAAAFLFGVLFTLSFDLFGTGLQNTGAVAVVGGWLVLTVVLLSTKWMILQHSLSWVLGDRKAAKAFSLPVGFKIAFALLFLIISLAMLLVLLADTDPAALLSVMHTELMPGIL